MSTEPTEPDHVTRIVDRLRRDHPDPEQRQQLYDDGKLPAYVEVLMQGHDGDVAAITEAVQAAEDGTPGPH